MTAYSPEMTTEQRQELLETIDVADRLRLASQFLAKQIEVLELKGRIQSEVKSEMDKTQREYILREQMKAIQKELGDQDETQKDIQDLREKIENAGMPEETKKDALKELNRLSRMNPAAADYSLTRTYVEWLAWCSTGPSPPPSRCSGPSVHRSPSPCGPCRVAPTTAAAPANGCLPPSTPDPAGWPATLSSPHRCSSAHW